MHDCSEEHLSELEDASWGASPRSHAGDFGSKLVLALIVGGSLGLISVLYNHRQAPVAEVKGKASEAVVAKRSRSRSPIRRTPEQRLRRIVKEDPTRPRRA